MRVLLVPQAGALGLGGVARCLAVAQEAAVRGHRVGFLTPDRMRAFVEDFDAEHFTNPLPPPPDVAAAFPFRLADSIRIRRMDDLDYLRATLRAELLAYRRFRPDVVFTENQLSTTISATVAKIPLFATTASVNDERFCSPLYEEADTLQGIEKGFNTVMEEHGLAAVGSVSELLTRHATKLIAPTSPRLEPLLVDTANLEFVGPLIYSRLDVGRLPFEVAERPLVYIYLSAGDVPLDRLLSALGDGVARDTGVQFIVSAKGHFGVGPHLSGGEGVRLVDLPPGVSVLRRASAAITHAGQNTTMACLLTGTPNVMFPGRNAERDFNARGVAALGAGIYATVDEVTSAELTALVHRVIDEPAFSVAADEFGTHLRGFDGVTRVVRLMEAI